MPRNKRRDCRRGYFLVLLICGLCNGILKTQLKTAVLITSSPPIECNKQTGQLSKHLKERHPERQEAPSPESSAHMTNLVTTFWNGACGLRARPRWWCSPRAKPNQRFANGTEPGKILEVADPKGLSPHSTSQWPWRRGGPSGVLQARRAPQPQRRRLVSSLARAHVGASRNPEVCSCARGRAPPAAFPAAGPPAPEAEATGGLPPGAAAAAIHRQPLLPGHVRRASPRLHAEAEPGVWRGRPRRRPSPVRSSGQRESRLEGRAPDRKPPHGCHHRRSGSRVPAHGRACARALCGL